MGSMPLIARCVLLAIGLIAANLGLTLLIAFSAGTVFDTTEFNARLADWHRTEQFPFPRWLLLVVPRLKVWPVSAELAYQITHAVAWGFNGYVLRRVLRTRRPVAWVWVPIALHLILSDPIQVVLGPVCFYIMARPQLAVRDSMGLQKPVRIAIWAAAGLVLLAMLAITIWAQFLSSSATPPAGGPQRPTSSPLRQKREAELERIARELRVAVLARDIETLLKYSPRSAELGEPRSKDDLPRLYGTYEADRRLLQDRTSWLYCLLFDTACVHEQARRLDAVSNPFYRVSIKEFFSISGDPEIRVLFSEEQPGGESLDLATILYVRPKSGLRLPSVISATTPVSSWSWGHDFVGLSLVRTPQGWRYREAMFTLARQ